MHTRTLLYSADNSIVYLTAPRRRISLTEGDTVYLTAPRSCRALTEGDRRGRDATMLAIERWENSPAKLDASCQLLDESGSASCLRGLLDTACLSP